MAATWKLVRQYMTIGKSTSRVFSTASLEVIVSSYSWSVVHAICLLGCYLEVLGQVSVVKSIVSLLLFVNSVLDLQNFCKLEFLPGTYVH